MLRIVLDTNVFISAIIKNGKPRILLQKGIDNNYILLTSKEIIEEIAGVLGRPKFKMTKTEVNSIVHGIIGSSKIISVKSKFRVVRDDPDDDIVVNTAYDGKADYVVSGDDDLLKIKDFKGIQIVTVSEILTILKRN